MPLGPGTPRHTLYEQLKALTAGKIFGHRKIADADMAQAVLAGIWLYHDFLDESHKISQEIPTPTGSYWHGIMHRREPDYDNARYWFRRVGPHPVFKKLDGEARKIGDSDAWEPFVFIDACERAAEQGGELEQTCREIQMREWWELFDYCYQRAVDPGT